MGSIVLVAGVSCSGKTTLARQLAAESDAAYLSIDDYYRSFDHLPLHQRKEVNFDAPDAIEHELLEMHVRLLRAGATAHKPVYDAAKFERMRGSEPIYPNDLFVIEGLFALYWPELRDHARLAVFVETDLTVCRERRLSRDVDQYGRSREEALHRYECHVKPSQERYVLPTKSFSDLVVAGDQPIDLALSVIRERLGIGVRSYDR